RLPVVDVPHRAHIHVRLRAFEFLFSHASSECSPLMIPILYLHCLASQVMRNRPFGGSVSA
ncbi:MAG: hypothetical protein J4N91_07485, partial [Chloroflexi bacterium]|nr:hypothetical protein [Chloroflexota bacterium]